MGEAKATEAAEGTTYTRLQVDRVTGYVVAACMCGSMALRCSIRRLGFRSLLHICLIEEDGSEGGYSN